MAELDDIYQLRKQGEENIRRTFEDLDIAAVTRANFPKEFQQKTPRVEIKIAIGAANGHRFICPDGFARYDRWRFTLAIQAVTKPANDGASILHEIFLGRIRKIASTLAQTTWTDTEHFPNIRFAEPLRDSGDTNTLKSNEGYESSVVSFTGTICIRESAWPTPSNITPTPPPESGPILDDDSGAILDDDATPVLSD